MKEKIPSLKKKNPKKIKIPPVKGTDDFEENFWWTSPVSFINILFFSKILLINKINIDNPNKYIKSILILKDKVNRKNY